MNSARDIEVVEFRWLGRRVRVEAGTPGLIDYLRRQWGSTVDRDSDPGSDEVLMFRIVEDLPDRPVLESDRGRHPLDHDLASVHAYNRILVEVLGSVERQFVFHATAVAGDDGAILISGPSTFGKSTLGLHLALTGLRWVADDVGILDRESGHLYPFDRPLRLRPGARATLSSGALDQALAARIVEEGDDWIVRPGPWLGMQSGPVPVRTVAILRSRVDGSSLRRFPFHTVRLRQEASGLADELTSLPGIADWATRADDAVRFELEVQDPTTLAAWLDDHADDVVYAVKFAPAAADFSGSPTLTPIPRFQAALELCQEMQNRHGNGRLGREFAGRATELVADVAVALGNARCFALTPGRLDETVALLKGVYESAP